LPFLACEDFNIHELAPKLTSVDFSHARGLGRRIISNFCKFHPKLTYVDCSYCSQFDPCCVEEICGQLKYLTVLRLSEPGNYMTMTNKIVKGLLCGEGGLVELNINGYSFTDSGTGKMFESVLMLNPLLTNLNIGKCGNLVCEDFLRVLALHCSDLTSLDVSFGSRLTQACVSIISHKLSLLRTLNLQGLILHTQTAVEMLYNLVLLSDIATQNNCHQSDDVNNAWLVLCDSFQSVTILKSHNGFHISGRRRLSKFHTDASAHELFAATSMDGRGLIRGIPKNAKHKSLFECLSREETLVSLTITGADAYYVPLYIQSGACVNLTSFFFVSRGCGDKLLSCIATHCKNLLKLTLTMAVTVTDAAIISLCVDIPGLTHLELIGLTITNRALTDGLALYLHKLVHLNLLLDKVTPTAVAGVILANRSLQNVTIQCNTTASGGVVMRAMNGLLNLKTGILK
jgi:hypothetical protein